MEDRLKVKLFGLTEKEIKSKISGALTSDTAEKIIINEQNLDACITIDIADNVQSRIAAREILTCFEQNIYSDRELTLAERLSDYLSLMNIKISVAESITGGLITSSLVSVPGISKYLIEGIVSYSNSSKHIRLNVSNEALKETAVSEKAAAQMAEGLLLQVDTDYAISATGYASPDKDNPFLPVGLTYIGIADRNRTEVYKREFSGTRDEIRHKAANAALFYLIKKLRANFDPNDYDN